MLKKKTSEDRGEKVRKRKEGYGVGRLTRERNWGRAGWKVAGRRERR